MVRLKKPLISIIVPVYNREDYIGECLDSICRQSWHNLEVIVVNDGSEDGSLQAIQDKVEEDARIRVMDLPHEGPSSARNAGIRNATGEYLTFVDSDDLVAPDYIERMVSEIGNADFCMTGFRRWEERKKQWTIREGISADYRGREICDHIEDYRKLISGIGWRMYRTSFIREKQLLFPEDICLSEDALFFLRALLLAEEAVFIHDTGYIVRKHSGHSLTSRGIFNVEIINRILRMYGELALETDNPLFLQEILRQQFNEINWAGKKICFQVEGHRLRKEMFLSLADENHIKARLLTGKFQSKTEFLIRMMLAFRVFFPFYLAMQLWCFFFPEKRRGFVSNNGK